MIRTQTLSKKSERELALTFATKEPSQACRIGMEYEKLGLRSDTLEAIPFEGPASVQSVLAELCAHHGWRSEVHGAFLTSLWKNDAVITLEPGGQLELSTPPRHVVDDSMHFELEHLKEMKCIGQKQGIVWSGLGMHPFSRVESISWVPKERYSIMREYFKSKGILSYSMMKRTSSIQVTLDYTDQADAARKFQTAMKMSPITTAIFANSCLSHGQLNGYHSFRSYIWQNTDADRCGLLPAAFNDDFSVMDYVQYALDTPLFFIERRGQFLGKIYKSFRQFMNEGWNGENAVQQDWETHLTCLFPEVRLRKWIEIRSADRQTGLLAFSVPVYLKSILYSPSAQDAMNRLLAKIRYPEAVEAMASAAKEGLKGFYGDRSMLDLARESIRIARSGLRDLVDKKRASSFEAKALSALEEMILLDGVSPAGRTIQEIQSGKSVQDVVRSQLL